MAIYHLSGSLISRSQGRSAVACSAYRSGEKLWDERYQKEQDYSRKKDVVYQQIFLPEAAPAWMGNREKLWNAVEASEKRKDAQLSREFNIALPRELSFSQNQELAKTFVLEQFVSQGMVADCCIHVDKTPEGESLYHLHVMLTLREVSESGFGPKVRAWNEKSRLLAWRQAWAETANKALALEGFDHRIDHRTLEAQGIGLEPQSKIGPKAAQAQLIRFEEHQRIAAENAQRLLENPQIALNALTQQQSTFTHQDIARFVNRHTVDETQFEAVYQAVKNCPELAALGRDEQNRERFSTREMLNLESKMLETAKALALAHGHPVKTIEAQAALTARALSPEQAGVFGYLVEPESIRCLIGYAGTGKSYLLGAAREAWEGSGFRVRGATLSGIAAQTLEGSSGIASSTVASLFYRWDRGEDGLRKKDILVIDEAGMLGSRQMARIVEKVAEAKAKLVLVGDPQQLQAIQAGAAFRAITAEVHYLELTEIRRQRIDWQKQATQELARGQVKDALSRYDRANHLHEYATQASAQQGLVDLWNDVRLSNSSQTQIMLAYTREAVKALNEQARILRQVQGELGQEGIFATHQGQRAFAENDRVYFLKNERSLGVMNGTLGTITQVREGELQVVLDKGLDKQPARTVRVDFNFYNHLDHGYAATVHKAQGVTVDRSYVLGSKYFDAHAAYVSLSRHRESVEVFWSREEFPRYQDLVQAFSRDRSKDISLDYGIQVDAGFTKGLEKDFKVSAAETHAFKGKQDFARDEDFFLQKREQLYAFKTQFEALHPEEAKRLQYEILPSSQKEALQERQLKEQTLKREPELVRESEKTKTQEREQVKILERTRTLEKDLGGLER